VKSQKLIQAFSSDRNCFLYISDPLPFSLAPWN
jgi:hypothetical protein